MKRLVAFIATIIVALGVIIQTYKRINSIHFGLDLKGGF